MLAESAEGRRHAAGPYVILYDVGINFCDKGLCKMSDRKTRFVNLDANAHNRNSFIYSTRNRSQTSNLRREFM